jgi:hypothetical protein
MEGVADIRYYYSKEKVISGFGGEPPLSLFRGYVPFTFIP